MRRKTDCLSSFSPCQALNGAGNGDVQSHALQLPYGPTLSLHSRSSRAATNDDGTSHAVLPWIYAAPGKALPLGFLSQAIALLHD